MERNFQRKAGVLAGVALALGLAMIQPVVPAAAADKNDKKASQTEHVIQSEGDGSVVIDWSEGVIRVTGRGTPMDQGSSVQSRLMAERKATASAYQQLASAINGIYVTSEARIKDFTDDDVTLASYVNSLIKGAQKVDQRYLDNGTIEVDLLVKLFSNNGLSGVIQPQKHVVPPPPVSVEADPKPGDFSGVIVDCRGLGLAPAMSPAIINQSGGEVYLGALSANAKYDPSYVINDGIVGYARTLEQARQLKRIGDKPLIIKGTSSTGYFHTDVIISEEDTKQLLGLEKANQLLSSGKVIFVM